MSQISKEIIRYSSIPGLASAIGPYSTCVTHNDLLFVSGQIGVSPTSSTLISDLVADQTRQILTNISTILSFFELSPKSIVKTTIFLTKMSDFAEVNKIYAEFFSGEFPSRSTVAVLELPINAKVEIEFIASLL